MLISRFMKFDKKKPNQGVERAKNAFVGKNQIKLKPKN